MRFSRLLLTLVLALVAPPQPGFSSDAAVPIETFDLDNGMRFYVVQRPELTTVSASWVAHVGSSNERPGITGLAHLFEHMMFKGSRTIGTTDSERDREIIEEQEQLQEEIRAIYQADRGRWRRGEIEAPYAAEHQNDDLAELQQRFRSLADEQRGLMVKDEFAKIYTDAGATFLNAMTSKDVTAYIINVPANKLELWFWMESERLLNPVFREFYTERDVVYEERRLRTEATATGAYDEQLNAMFWGSHPYSWPIVGWPSDLRVITKQQADEFFSTYYAPNNLSAILVGNVDIAEARRQAERYFGRIPRGDVAPPDVVTLEMEQLAEKRMVAECDCPPQLNILYHTAPFGHRDDYVLDVFSGLLNGRTGRLYKSMIEGAEIASSARVANLASKWAGSFSVSAETKGDHAPEDLLAQWEKVLAELQQSPVSAAELDKVKNILTADVYRRLESPFYLMMQLALYTGQGDATYLNTFADRVAAVTAEDVHRLANTYFDPANRLVGVYTRKEGTRAEEVPSELEALPAEMRQRVLQQIDEINGQTEAAPLEEALSQVRSQSEQVPAAMKPAFAYMIQVIQQRLEVLANEGAR